MKNKTDIDALEKAVGILDNDYLDGHEIVTLQLSIKDFIHQYKQEIHIAVDDVPDIKSVSDSMIEEAAWDCYNLINKALEERYDKRK